MLALLVQPIVVLRAVDPPVSILGAADGQVKLLAETAQVSTDITVESTATTETKGTFRVSPLRDAAGHLFPVTLTAAPPRRYRRRPLRLPAECLPSRRSAAEQPCRLSRRSCRWSVPALGAWSAHISAVLPAEGDYTGELIVGIGDTPVRVKLTITRASRNLDVEVLGVGPARARAGAWTASTATLILVLSEKTGRALTLDPPVVTTFERKGSDGARFQAPRRVTVDGRAPGPVALTPNGMSALALTFNSLDGAGEYTGTIRFSAPGSKPVDQDFTLDLRESQLGRVPGHRSGRDRLGVAEDASARISVRGSSRRGVRSCWCTRSTS